MPTTTRGNPTLANTWSWFSEGDSSYNALQVDLNRRFNGGLSLRGVYTFSKALDDGDSLNATTSGGGPALAANPYHLRADWGRATYDVTHIAVVNATYGLPLGKGKRFFTSMNGFGNALVGGWMVNSIISKFGK